ncbi:MAG: hypothetical protein ACRDUV_21130, partial [Pseudonocardiaceae bacterium]
VSVKTVDKRFAYLREQAGLPAELTLHCLRHSYVTHLVEFGYPERFVTVLLSPVDRVQDVHHGHEGCADLRGGGGYLPPSITQSLRRFDAGATSRDALLVA